MNKRKKSVRAYALLACAVTAWCTMPSYAQAKSADGMENLVVVRATRAEEIAKQEPQRVAIITKKDIEQKQAKTVEDVIFTQTGVSKTVDGMGRTGVSIRGAEARHTLILVDGQPVMGEFAKYMGAADEVSRIGTENVDHIEIIQGAASAKYGADAIGGVVNVITKKAKKKPALQFNIEARQTAEGSKGLRETPYNNFYLRADSGKIGNARIAIYGSKRDVMPIYASKQRISVGSDMVARGDMEDFPKNSLRYFGNTSNIGLMGTYDLGKNQKIEVRADHFNEDLERFVKRSNSNMEPMLHFKRKADRDTYNLAYSGRLGKTDWRIEGNYTHMKEDDVGLSTKYANNAYEGKNTLYSIDNIDHKMSTFKTTINHAPNEKHLITFGMGYSKEDGQGSRLKSAPDTYKMKIDPWDYDKSLFVDAKISNKAANATQVEKSVASRVHDYKFTYDKNGVPTWNVDSEFYGYEPGDKKSPISFNDYINNYRRYNDSTLDDTEERILPKLTKEQEKARDEFIDLLYQENKEAFHKAFDYKRWDGSVWVAGEKEKKKNLILSYFGYEKNNSAPNFHPTFNGKHFMEEYNKRANVVTFGKATIKKYYFTIQDTWNMGLNTIFTPIIRFDHSSIFGSNISASAGITHKYKGDPNTRLKANIGTGYSEPGMGELYYNWQMYGATPSGFGEARLGWYWHGNPNLKPEKSLNMDIGFEKDMHRTSLRAGVFHNKIKNYMSVYFTGSILDFTPWLNNSHPQGFWKFFNAPDMIYSFKNIGKAEITGADFEVKQKMGKHWEARVGYTYLNARNKTDKTMPAHLLDKPVHKVDIGISYKDKKRGWSGSIWENYYIDMLDSNSLANGGSYMTSGAVGAPDIKYKFTDKSKHEYEKKTYGIWNAMIQKELGKDTKVYFGVNNIFNHRDDDRAIQEKVYRAGLNYKVTDLFDTTKSIDSVTGKVKEAKMMPFITKPFDETKELGVNWSGDIRVRNNEFLGENRPPSSVTVGTMASENAIKNLRDKKGTNFETRMRFGIESRIAKNTELKLIGSLSSSDPTDTAQATGNKGPKNAKVEKVSITQHVKNIDFSVGRIQEKLGVTGYWFNKEFDGGKAIYTNKDIQIELGYGSFKHTTGIEDSPYMHATHASYYRPPYLEEFLGLQRENYGSFEYDLLTPEKMPQGNNNVAFVAQIMELADKFQKDYPNEVIIDNWYGTKKVNIASKNYPVKAMLDILKHMHGEAEKAYAGNPKLFNAGDKKANTNYGNTFGVSVPIIWDDFKLKVSTNDGEKTVEGGWWGDFSLDSKGKAYPGLAINLGDTSIFEGTDKDPLKGWWDKNGQNYISTLEEMLQINEKDKSIKIVTPPNEIKSQIEKALFGKESSSQFTVHKKDGTTDKYYVPTFIADYINAFAKALDLVDGEALIPREALASTEYKVKEEGTLLVGDKVPSIHNAYFLKGKYNVNDKLGITAWHFRSINDDEFIIENANGDKNDVSTYTKYANVFGLGARYKLNDSTAISVDAGMNITDFGKHLNGETIYNHTPGSNVFEVKGHKNGSTPKFWTARLDIGATDTNIPGSWNAFADYKHFEHGAFFGGNGTESLPDRYLDGIKSFTFGAGYVPAKNWLIEAFYTFGAKGINKRDTLFGGENFKLGNYTRVQLTFKF